MRDAVAKFGSDNIADISKAVGTRSEAQVRAHLRNVKSRERAEREVDAEGSVSAGKSSSSKKEENAHDGGDRKSRVVPTNGSSHPGKEVTNSAKGAISAAASTPTGSVPPRPPAAKTSPFPPPTATPADANGYTSKSPVALQDETPPEERKRRGGRGKKPPTSALHTVPNANFDARSLLSNIGRKS